MNDPYTRAEVEAEKDRLRAHYPEHERMKAARDTHGTQHIGDFLEWLGSTGRYVCERGEYETLGGFQRSELMPVRHSIQELLAEYAEIDLNKIEAEKRAMLDALREAQP